MRPLKCLKAAVFEKILLCNFCSMSAQKIRLCDHKNYENSTILITAYNCVTLSAPMHLFLNIFFKCYQEFKKKIK